MNGVLHDLVLFSCLTAFVTGMVIATATRLSDNTFSGANQSHLRA
jgi:hypothetical protein